MRESLVYFKDLVRLSGPDTNRRGSGPRLQPNQPIGKSGTVYSNSTDFPRTTLIKF